MNLDPTPQRKSYLINIKYFPFPILVLLLIHLTNFPHGVQAVPRPEPQPSQPAFMGIQSNSKPFASIMNGKIISGFTGEDSDEAKESAKEAKKASKKSSSSSSSNAGHRSTAPDKKEKEVKMPSYNLGRRPGQSKEYNKQKVEWLPVKEMDCIQSFFMSPFHDPVPFNLTGSIYGRHDKTCKWAFIGTEQCIPSISCDTSKLTKECDTEYLEIVDGVGGQLKVCGGSHKEVSNIQSSGDMRDLYIHYKVLKGGGKKDDNQIFQCTVVCSKRGAGTKLKRVFENWQKVNAKCLCGTKPNEDRIMNGENAKKFEYPWLITLVETNTRQPFCGASIINNRFAQTAGHCIKGKFTDYRNIQVMVNGHFFDMSPNTAVIPDDIPARTYPVDVLEQLDKSNGTRRYNVDEIIVHPLYISETNDFDIALLRLSEDIDLNPKQLDPSMESILQQPRQICLPPLGSYLRTYANKHAIIAGWGLPGAEAEGTMQILQKLEVHVYSQKDCKGMFAHRVNRRMICAGYREGGRDSCAGDSGGPLVMEDRPKVWIQIGSVSFGEGCGEEEHPGVYFRTAEGAQWITYHSNYNGQRAGESEDDSSATFCLVPP